MNNELEGFTTLAVAIGRIEEKVNAMTGIDDRLREVEKSVERIEARETPKTPWHAIVGGIAAIGSIALSVLTLILFISTGALSH